jgi:hypothetical protein
MATRISVATLGYQEHDYDEMNIRSQIVHDIGMYSTDGVILYPNPFTSKINYKKQLDICIQAQNKTKDGCSKEETTYRNEQCEELHSMNLGNVGYANGLFRGQKNNLEKSGYLPSAEPVPHGVPPPPDANRAVKGPFVNSSKIFLKHKKKLIGVKPERLMYTVYVTEDPTKTDDLKVALRTTNSFKLIILNVPKDKTQYYYVTAQNAAGESESSPSVKYLNY